MTLAPVYLDYNATTPVDPRVADAVVSALRDRFGNPSSSHAFGRAANDAVGTARGQVAGLVQVREDEDQLPLHSRLTTRRVLTEASR